MLLQTYEYRLQARRPATYLALGVGLVTAYAVVFTNALIAALPVAAYLMVVLWRLWRNPTAGIAFTPDKFEMFDRFAHHTFPIKDIRAVRLKTGVFTDDECVLELANGMRIALPPDALPKLYKLRFEFARRGIIAD